MVIGEGEIPNWYLTVIAARELQVPPWELHKQPITWRERALTARRAEATARQQRQSWEDQKAEVQRMRGG